MTHFISFGARCSGRTTRMIQNILESGKNYILLVGESHQHAQALLRILHDSAPPLSVTYRSGDEIRFRGGKIVKACRRAAVRSQTLARPGVTVFTDHFAWECAYMDLLELGDPPEGITWPENTGPAPRSGE